MAGEMILNQMNRMFDAPNPLEMFMSGQQSAQALDQQRMQNLITQNQVNQLPLMNQFDATKLQQIQQMMESQRLQDEQTQLETRNAKISTAAREALAMPESRRLPFLVDFANKLDPSGEKSKALLAMQAEDPAKVTAALEQWAGQGKDQMTEYQRENLRLQEERLRLNAGISPEEQQRLDIQNQRLELERQKQELAQQKQATEQQELDKKKQDAAQAAKTRATLITNDLDRALGKAGALTTGFLGARTKGIEGTESYDLAQILDGIKANVGFQELNEMRKNSPTGGALGNVTERETVLLQRVLGSLEQEQSKEQFMFNTNRAKVIFDAVVNGTNPIPFTKQDYDKLESGRTYIDPDDGRLYRKP